MTTTRSSRSRRRTPEDDALAYQGLAAAVKLGLCVLRTESAPARRLHLAGLLSWNDDQVRDGAALTVRFDHGPTAWWVTEVIASPAVEVIDLDGHHGTIRIHRPQRVLDRWGYRDGRWLGGHGPEASLGAVRGAVHAAAVFDRTGMTIPCPSATSMLNITGLMRRLGIPAFPTSGPPRAVVGPAAVPEALERLGLGSDVVAEAQRLRDLARKDRSA